MSNHYRYPAWHIPSAALSFPIFRHCLTPKPQSSPFLPSLPLQAETPENMEQEEIATAINNGSASSPVISSKHRASNAANMMPLPCSCTPPNDCCMTCNAALIAILNSGGLNQDQLVQLFLSNQLNNGSPLFESTPAPSASKHNHNNHHSGHSLLVNFASPLAASSFSATVDQPLDLSVHSRQSKKESSSASLRRQPPSASFSGGRLLSPTSSKTLKPFADSKKATTHSTTTSKSSLLKVPQPTGTK